MLLKPDPDLSAGDEPTAVRYPVPPQGGPNVPVRFFEGFCGMWGSGPRSAH